LRCPRDDSHNWTAPLAGATALRKTSYTLNGYLPPANSTEAQGGNFPSVSAVDKPASVIFLAESNRNRTGNYFHAHVWDPPASTNHWLSDIERPDDLETKRHGEGFNVSYLDGHAKHVRWTQVWWRDDSVTPPMKGAFDPRQ
jgi:prepilin-type processing-associated H-X9-DG protein